MKQIDKYLQVIQEQFDGRIASTDIKGDFNNEWTNCYEIKCNRQFENKYEKDYCKATCILTAVTGSIARLNSIKGKCTTSENPNRCISILDTAINSFKNKIITAREAQNTARAKMADFRRNAAGA